MKRSFTLFIIFILGNLSIWAQCSLYPNIDLESGTAGWSFFSGKNTSVIAGPFMYTWSGPSSTPIALYHEITPGTIGPTDPFIPLLPTVSPFGGVNSLRLNTDRIGSRASKAQYVLTVPPGPAKSTFTYSYALVLEDPVHSFFIQPHFSVTARNLSTGVVTPCNDRLYVSGAPSLGSPFINVVGTDIWYLPWQQASFVLPSGTYAIDFIVADCSAGGHFGYAYIDMQCGGWTNEVIACAPATVTLPTAPAGFMNYTWYKVPSWTTPIGTGASLPSFPAPSSSTSYGVVLQPFPGAGCAETLYVNVGPPTMPTATITSSAITGTGHCEGDILEFCIHADPGTDVAYDGSPCDLITGIPFPCSSTAHAMTSGVFCQTVVATPPSTNFHLILVSNPSTGCIENLDLVESICVGPHLTEGNIVGPDTLCGESTATYSNPTGSSGGLWSCSPSTIATIDPITGVLTLSPHASGVVTITYMNSSCCNNVLLTKILYVKPMPYFNIVYTGCSPACPNTPLYFTITGLPHELVTYGWADPSGATGTGTITLDISGTAIVGPLVPLLTPGFFHFGIINATFDGCTNISGIEVFPVKLEWPTAYFTSEPGGLCDGDCVYLEVQGTPGSTAIINPGGIPVVLNEEGKGTSPCIVIHGETTYTIGDVMNSCCSHYSGSHITVHTLNPIVTLTCAPNPVCEGLPFSITATSTPSSLFFDWMGPAWTYGFSSSTSSFSFSNVAMSDGGLYTVTGHVGNCSTSVSKLLTVFPKPTGSMTCDYDGCRTILHFTGTPMSTLFYDSYPSGISGSLLLPSGTASVPVTVTVPTNIFITGLLSADGCSSLVSFLGCAVFPPGTPAACVEVDPMYDYFNITGTDPSCIVTYNLYNNLHALIYTGSAHAGDVLTTFPSGTLSICITSITCGECTRVFEPDPNYEGYYPCCAWLRSPAARTVHNSKNNNTEIEYKTNIVVTPNPNRGVFTIKGYLPKLNGDKQVKIESVNMLGQIVFSDVLTVEDGLINKTISLGDNIPNGIYLMRVTNNDVTEVVRFMLSR